MLNIHVLRAVCETTVHTRASCVVCGMEFELGVVYAWLDIDRYGPDELCERCLRSLCEWARTEGLDVPWKDAYATYEDARRRYTEPITTSEALGAMSLEEESRICAAAYLS